MATKPSSTKPSSAKSSSLHSLPSMQSAAKALHAAVANEMHDIRSLAASTASMARRFETLEGRKAFREGVKYGKDALEAAQKTAEKLHFASEYHHVLDAIPKYSRYAEQALRDVARIKADSHLADIAAQAGNEAAQAAKTFLRPMLIRAEAIHHNERSMLHGFQLMAAKSAETAGKFPEKIALQAEALLSKSRVGREILEKGKILENEHLGHLLKVVGVASSAWAAYDDSEGSGRRGKMTHAVMEGVAQAATLEAQAFDPLIEYGSRGLGVEKKTAEGLTVGKWVSGTMSQFYSLGIAVWRHDAEPLNELHRHNMAGDNGVILKGYAMLGEEIASSRTMEHVMDQSLALEQRGLALAHGVSREVTRSLSWWRSLGSSQHGK